MINATKTTSNYEPVPQVTHCARIYQVIHIGTVSGFEGKMQNKVRINFELPNETKEFKEGEGQKPYSIAREYTLSFHEKASLRGLIEACIGSCEGEMEYNVENLIGKTCLLNIKHKVSTKDGQTYAQVDTASPLPKGMICPSLVNQTLIFSHSNFDHLVFKELPDFLHKKIENSLEYQKMMSDNGGVPF